jgi:hypothetical protein
MALRTFTGKYAVVESSSLKTTESLYLPADARMSDLDLKPREVQKQSDRLQPNEGEIVRKIQASRGIVFLFPALALFAYMPLVLHSKNINLTCIDIDF